MATVTITATSFCQGGGHVNISVTGDRTGDFELPLDDLRSTATREDIENFLKVACKIAKIGRTNAQLKTLLQSGLVITL